MKLTIIGGGPGGYTAAFAAAKAGAEATLIERAHLGGTCLHTGCIPTKTLRSSADALDTVARLREFGIAGDCTATPDMSAIVARKRKVTATLQTGLEKTAAQLKSVSFAAMRNLSVPGSSGLLPWTDFWKLPGIGSFSPPGPLRWSCLLCQWIIGLSCPAMTRWSCKPCPNIWSLSAAGLSAVSSPSSTAPSVRK